MKSGVDVSKGNIDDLHDVENIRRSRTIDIRVLNRAVTGRFRWFIAEGDIHCLYHIENVRPDAVATGVGMAWTIAGGDARAVAQER